MSSKKCKVCDAPTEAVFNINLKAVPICEGCATAIFLQQAVWYGKEVSQNNKVMEFIKTGRYK